MKTITAVLVLTACVTVGGCNKAPGPLHQQVVSGPQSGYLNFTVTSTVALSEGRTLKVSSEAEPWLEPDWLSWEDSLQQPNGNWIIFDCNNIADKIIDAQLVKEITPICSEVHSSLKSYWKSVDYSPHEFTDTTGKKWVAAK